MLLVCYGTRPEYLKVQPLIEKMRGVIPFKTLFTGQHEDMVYSNPDYSIVIEYWKEHTELSAHGDTPDLDDRYADLIVTRARYYAYNLRSDPEHAMIANKEFENGLKRLRTDLISKQEYMRDERVNLRVSMY